MADALTPQPRHAAVSLEVNFAGRQQLLLQARVAMRPIAPAAEAGHTGWFLLTPEVARRMAADLLEAAAAAEGRRDT